MLSAQTAATEANGRVFLLFVCSVRRQEHDCYLYEHGLHEMLALGAIRNCASLHGFCEAVLMR
jgi:hypothetical protein